MELTDEEFLNYCAEHCRTQVAGFTKANLDRLLKLAGKQPLKGLREDDIYRLGPGAIMPYVNMARARLRK